MGFVRPAAVAGSFYPADPTILAAELRAMLDAAPAGGPVPKALIAPHAGYIYSGPIAAAAYAKLAPARDKITKVVLIGPAHRVGFQGIATSSAEGFATPLGIVPLDKENAAKLRGIQGVGDLDQAHQLEHSLEVHLPFLQTLLDKFTLLPLVAGGAPDMLVAQVLNAVWGGPETLIVVSSDLSHYEDYDSAQSHDRATAEAIGRFDAAAFDHHGACGRIPLGGLLLLGKQRGMRIESLDLRNSGDTAGPRDRVVGYGSWALYDPSLPDILLDLARRSIAQAFETAPGPLTVAGLPEIHANGASFVTLKKDGQLRGCIGSAQAWRPLGEDVADNARRAAFNDPRFSPLTAEEWPQVRLSLSLLTAPEPMQVTSRDDLLRQLRPHVDGLILEDGAHRSLFLPAVWEQLPTAEDFVAHLLHKGGLPPSHWSPSMKAWRFTAEEHQEG